MGKMRVYVVEDDKWYGEFIKYQVELDQDAEVKLFTSGNSILKEKNAPDIICLDIRLPDIPGDQLLSSIKTIWPDSEVIIISGQDDISLAVQLLRDGAYDYITKDDETRDRIINTIFKIKEKNLLREKIVQLEKKIELQDRGKYTIIGESESIKRVNKLISKASKVNLPVSITGETGTGKELVAQSIHLMSQLKGSFVAVNVAAIPSELVESELFGHVKGAFTGADKDRKGKFEEANNGTLFLDEIGEMDQGTQSKILRAIQEQEITPVGSNKTIKVNVRLISATHKKLLDEVSKGHFRQDLFYRIAGIPIEIDPLRMRGNDVIILANYFLDKFIHDQKFLPKKLGKSALDKLQGYSFPGNIRELKAIVELAAIMSEGETINESDITFHEGKFEIDQLIGEHLTLEEYNQYIIEHFLKKCNRNVVETAKALNIGKSTIYRMINSNKIKL